MGSWRGHSGKRLRYGVPVLALALLLAAPVVAPGDPGRRDVPRERSPAAGSGETLAAPRVPDGAADRSVEGRWSRVVNRTAGDTTRLDLQALAQDTDRAVEAVLAVWDRRASEGAPRVLVEVSAGAGDPPGAAATATAGSGRDGPTLAAYTTGPVGSERSSRVVVIAPEFARLSGTGRRVVLTHEVTHVLTRRATGAATPAWLSEGFADYVAYRDAGIPVSQAAGGVLERVRRGPVPSSLPGAGDFVDRPGDGSPGPTADEAYQAAWLACRGVAKRYGEERLVRLYRAYAEHPTDRLLPPEARDGVVRDVLGVSEDHLVAQWRSDLRREAR